MHNISGPIQGYAVCTQGIYIRIIHFEHRHLKLKSGNPDNQGRGILVDLLHQLSVTGPHVLSNRVESIE